MKKKVLVLLCCILCCIGLTGCGNKPSKVYEAYKEFYRGFYTEHLDTEYAVGDCCGQILMDEKNNPLLAICDVSGSGDSAIVDVYVYKYEGGKVQEVARKTGLMPEDDGISIASVDGVVTMYVPEVNSEETFTTYVLSEYGFEKESFAGMEDLLTEDGEIDPELKAMAYATVLSMMIDVDSAYPLYSMFFVETSGVCAINGSNFEMLLSQLAEAEPDNPLGVKLVYTDFFKRAGIYEEPGFSYLEDEKAYAYNSAEDKFYYYGNYDMIDYMLATSDATDEITLDDFLEAGVLKNMPKKLGKVEVELSNFLKMVLLELIDVDEFKEFNCQDDVLTVKAEHDLDFEVSTAYTDSDGENSKAGWRIRVVTGGNETDGYTYEKIDATYEQIKKYLDAGLATDISLDVNLSAMSMSEMYIENVTIFLPDMESYVSLMTEEEKEDYITKTEVLPAFEEYLDENYGSSGYDVYNLIYIDENNIPELLYDGSADGRGTIVLCYQDGVVHESDAWCRGFGFYYVPKGNKVIYEGYWLGDETGSVAHLENGVLVEEHSYYFDFDDAMGFGGVYFADAVECSETEYNNFRETYFKYEDMRYGWETYDSILEAYENIGRFVFSSDGGYITKFEMSDNVLTVETEEGQYISYPVADNCAWEATSYGEVYDTYTYEELKSEMESERERYLADPEWYESPMMLFVEVKDDVIIRIYTMSA